MDPINAIEYNFNRYKDEKGIPPTKVFLSTISYSRLIKTVTTSYAYSNSLQTGEWLMGAKYIHFHSMDLEMCIVKESGEFMMVGRDDDYANYVFEKVVMK